MIEPKILFVLLEQKRRIDLNKMRTLAYLNQGGTIEDEDEEVPGLDRPANESEVAFLRL